MRTLLAFLLCVALPAFAQAPGPATAAPSVKAKDCDECGVVRSVRMVTKEARPAAADDTRPSGLVGTVPLGSSGGKPQFGSSTKLGKESTTMTTTWEVIVRLDDGRFRVLVLDEAPEVREGDKVRIDQGKVALRAD